MQGQAHFVVVGWAPAWLAIAVLVAACSSGRATSDASTIGRGGTTGSAGMGGGSGTGGVNVDGGAGGESGNGGTGARGGAGGESGNGGTGARGGSGGGGGTGGAGGTVPGDAGTIPCGDGGACAASQVCVRSVTGGASYVCPDAGLVTFPPNCDGLVVDMYGCCYGYETSSYACAARPSGCGATVTCACAASLCTSGSCSELGASEIACLRAGT